MRTCRLLLRVILSLTDSYITNNTATTSSKTQSFKKNGHIFSISFLFVLSASVTVYESYIYQYEKAGVAAKSDNRTKNNKKDRQKDRKTKKKE